MNIAVMQPYLFPYAGYFNLLAQVDKFVFFDDVNYINRGWINRNRLLLAGDVRYFTIPLIKASQNLKINQIYIQPKDIWLQKTLHTIKQSYAKAPNFHAVYDLLKEVFAGDSLTISDMARDSIKKTCSRLELTPKFIESSSIYDNAALKGAERILDICRHEGARRYFNLPGGRDLYEASYFNNAGVELVFCDFNLPSYFRFEEEAPLGLSIIDMLMFNDFSTCRELLGAG